MDRPAFRETQHFNALFYGLTAGLALLGGYLFLRVLADEASLAGLVVGGVCVAIGAGATLLMTLRTRVCADRLHLQLGWLPVIWRSVPMDQVESARVVSYRPLMNAGGWGLRWGVFEGKPCTWWNARGNRGVLLELVGGKRLVIGSKQPDTLHAAIEDALQHPAVTSAAPSGSAAASHGQK
jgi:hypothetical protein